FCANQARRERGINRGAFHADSPEGGLRDRVLLAVTTEALVQPGAGVDEGVAAGTAPLVAILGAAGRSIVARRDNPLIFDNDRRHLSFYAIAAAGDDLGDAHKIFVPTRTREVATYLLEQGIDLPGQILYRAVVDKGEIRQGGRFQQLLLGDVRALRFAPLGF